MLLLAPNGTSTLAPLRHILTAFKPSLSLENQTHTRLSVECRMLSWPRPVTLTLIHGQVAQHSSTNKEQLAKENRNQKQHIVVQQRLPATSGDFYHPILKRRLEKWLATSVTFALHRDPSSHSLPAHIHRNTAWQSMTIHHAFLSRLDTLNTKTPLSKPQSASFYFCVQPPAKHCN